ncbi:hypothetical protein AB5I41_12245 [Sphingomonas sp. MMS24-JH45]
MHPDRPAFAVIVRGVPGDAAGQRFPEPLRFAIRPDGTTDTARPLEPLAPDAQKLDRRAVRLKLIAGTLGIGDRHPRPPRGAAPASPHRRDRDRRTNDRCAVAVVGGGGPVSARGGADELLLEARPRRPGPGDPRRHPCPRRLPETAAEQLRLLSADMACPK